MSTYDRLADLPLVIEREERSRQERDTTSGFRRTTTTVALSGEGETGRGEDVTYDAVDHDALADAPAFDLAGEYTVDSFSAKLDDVDLFPTKVPERKSARDYRRWAYESAALDLALRQAGENLGSALGRNYEPVRFVVSTRLGEPPAFDRVRTLRERVPGLAFKLDPTSDWSVELMEELAGTGAVRLLDLKGWYEGTDVDQTPDADLYERVLASFPDAVVEDAAFEDETMPLLADHVDRLSFDAPIHGVRDIETMPIEPRWLNIKPSRFGTAESLFDALDYCIDRGIRTYGGGQFELGVGREQIQALASLFYPQEPNDVAPGVYNDPELPAAPEELPTSPLAPPSEPKGLGWE